MMSEELFEQAKRALLRPDEVKARCGPSNIADIRRRLSNSRMRCSCSAFDTLLVATAKGKAPTLSGASGWWDSRFCAASSFPCQPCSPNGRRPQISKRHRPPGLAGPAGMRCLDPRDSDCNRQKFQRASGLAPCNSGVVPSDDRRLTVLHRREGGPSSIYFAPASQAACDPVAVRRAEHFGIGGVFSH